MKLQNFSSAPQIIAMDGMYAKKAGALFSHLNGELRYNVNCTSGSTTGTSKKLNKGRPFSHFLDAPEALPEAHFTLSN